MTRCALTFAAALALSACGFHLRGAVVLPDAMKVTAIQGVPATSEIAAEVRQALESAGGRVVDDPAEAAARLEIQKEAVNRRVASVNSEGRASEYQVSYRLSYRLLGREGELVPSQTISLTRDYAYDSANVLGSGQEEARLVEEMRRAGVRQMLRRLRLTLSSSGRKR